MKEKDIQSRMRQLQDTIEHHNHLYHTLDTPEISDEAYDSLVKELILLETKYPLLRSTNSPTTRAGSVVVDYLEKFRHTHQQWSFDNIFNKEELQLWHERLTRLLQKEGHQEGELDYCA